MRKTNEGITLIALVITIIILLILAGISIASLTGSGLFENAKEAKNRSVNAEILENSILNEYEEYIDELEYNNGDEKKWEEILEKANNNPEEFRHEEQKNTNTIGIGTNGEPVNMDLWMYVYTDYEQKKSYTIQNPEGLYERSGCIRSCKWIFR